MIKDTKQELWGILKKLVGKTTKTLYEGTSDNDMWGLDQAQQQILSLFPELLKYKEAISKAESVLPERMLLCEDDCKKDIPCDKCQLELDRVAAIWHNKALTLAVPIVAKLNLRIEELENQLRQSEAHNFNLQEKLNHRPSVVSKTTNGEYVELFINGVDVLKKIKSPLVKMKGELREALKEAREYFEQTMDADDGKPNDEMVLFMSVDKAIKNSEGGNDE